jgi:DNA-binding MarR family transcriptional regulator
VQFVLLMSTWWLVEHDGPPTQQALADHAGTDPMMTSQVLRKLADRDLLVRRADPADARARRLDLTAAGRDLLTAALADVEQADHDYFAAAGKDGAALVRGLRKLA